MSKIKKLTTQFEDSMIFSPKMVAETRKNKDKTPKTYTLKTHKNMDKSEYEKIPIKKDEEKSYLEIAKGYFSSVIEYCDIFYFHRKSEFEKEQQQEDKDNKEQELIIETNLENEEKKILKSIQPIETSITLENRQLARMYTHFIIENKFTSYPYIRQQLADYNDAYKKVVFEYLEYIKNKPKIALCSLLWIDSFHDFKKTRIEGQSSSVNLNKIINNLTYYVNGKISNIDTVYRDSFFNNNKTDFEITHISHTVLAPCIDLKDRIKFSKILYDLSEKLISDSEFESDLLHTYMMYMFKFNIKDKDNSFDCTSLLNDLRNISLINIPKEWVKYWAKDVDKSSSTSIGGYKVILPASIFDKNPSNSSSIVSNFVNIGETVIPYANGYRFIYSFKKDSCDLTIGYEEHKISKYSSSISSCEESINSISDTIKEFDDLLSELEYQLKKNKDKDKCIKLNKYITSSIKQLSEKELFFNNKGKIDLKGQKGFSPKLVIYQIIILLCKKIVAKNKKRLTCAELDFWFSLKRIGDYGQILQCKQLGIPLFTNDKMQILLCLVTRTNSISSIDGWIPVYYNGEKDCFISSKNECSIGRKNEYDIDKVLKGKGFDKIFDSETILKDSASSVNKIMEKELEGYKVDISKF